MLRSSLIRTDASFSGEFFKLVFERASQQLILIFHALVLFVIKKKKKVKPGVRGVEEVSNSQRETNGFSLRPELSNFEKEKEEYKKVKLF